MHVVQQLYFFTTYFTNVFEHLWHSSQIFSQVCIPIRATCIAGRLKIRRNRAKGSYPAITALLNAYVPVALLNKTLYRFSYGFYGIATGMDIRIYVYTAASAKQLINRHVCTLSLDIP